MAGGKRRNEALRGKSCPTCKAVLDAAAAGDGSDKEPQPGDVTVCFRCGAVLQFMIGLALIPAPDNVLVELAGDESFKRALSIQQEISEAIRKKEKGPKPLLF